MLLFLTTNMAAVTSRANQQFTRFATLYVRDLGGAVSLRYRNRAEITVLVCEQKPYPIWF